MNGTPCRVASCCWRHSSSRVMDLQNTVMLVSHGVQNIVMLVNVTVNVRGLGDVDLTLTLTLTDASGQNGRSTQGLDAKLLSRQL